MTNQIYFIYFREMGEKERMREDFCQDCELGTQIDNCRYCLLNVLCNKPPLVDLPKHKGNS